MKKRKFAHCKRSFGDIPVQNGLSVTPSQMLKLAEQGVPVTSQNLESQFYDGDTRPSWDVPLDQQRGIDVATIWQRRKDISRRLHEGHQADVRDYGVATE